MYNKLIAPLFRTFIRVFHTKHNYREDDITLFYTFATTKRILLMGKYLIISTSVDLVRIASDKIVYFSSDGNYSNLVDSNGDIRLLTFQLGQIERMIDLQLKDESSSFIRIGKCLIINRNYIHYINISKQKLILADSETFSHTLSASKESLKQLKELIEKEVK